MTSHTAIDAIFFDVGNTLRVRVDDAILQHQAADEFVALLNASEPQLALFERLEARFDAYRRWARATHIEASEEDFWVRWMLPEWPAEQIRLLAWQLILLWQKRLGRRIMRPGTPEVVRELSRRGYHLGIISNTLSAHSAVDALAEHGLLNYFSPVLLSCVFGRRKPDPTIFLAATDAAGVNPARSAYLGDKPEYDVVGARQAGFAVSIIIAEPDQPLALDATCRPDCVIHDLAVLLDMFPPRTETRNHSES